MAGNAPAPTPDYDTLAPEIPGGYASGRTKALLFVLQVLLDVVTLSLGFFLGYIGRLTLPFFSVPALPPPFSVYLLMMVGHVLTIVVLFYFTRLYHQRRTISRIDQGRQITGAVAIGALMANSLHELLFKNTIFQIDYPRAMFFYVVVFSVLLTIFSREMYARLRRWLRSRGIDRDNLLIVGTSNIAREIAKKIRAHPELGYQIVGVVNGKKGKMLGIPILGGHDDLPALIDTLHIQQVIIALPDAQRTELVDLITQCQRGNVDVKVYPDMFAYMAGDMDLDDLGGMPLVTVRDIALRGWKLSLKRALDIVGATGGLILLSPLLLLTALLIRLESKGPVFYTQERMGLDGRPFPMIKFRSMRADAEAEGPGWTVKDDPRVTKIGKLMRRTNWDELPQLVNVFVGQMSLVGPRPERPVYVQQFRQHIPRYMERHREKAGMTGWAQVNGLRGDTSIAERTAYDLWYVENWSLWLDIKIIIRTLFNTVMRRDTNAY
ncbi:MAG: undecaprenyl-phosphate glucose phosphotransferase [Chloroflexi bacterium]|nr:undecaprenyl-phosphate glucose phosphotransferase [Chloroflexota bacterium]